MSRYEMKYIFPVEQVPKLVERLSAHSEPDTHAPDGRYHVNSLYYDSSDYRFYYENLDGIRYRRKLRDRHYGDFSEEAASFVEIKEKNNRLIGKKRILVFATDRARFWNQDDSIPWNGPKPEQIWRNEILHLVHTYQLRPKVFTIYTRRAFFIPGETQMRITIDSNLFGLRWQPENIDYERRTPLLSPEECVVELKGKIRVPIWLTNLIKDFGLFRTKCSKYCLAVEKT